MLTIPSKFAVFHKLRPHFIAKKLQVKNGSDPHFIEFPFYQERTVLQSEPFLFPGHSVFSFDENIFKYFRLEENFFVRHENIFGFFWNYLEKSTQFKGKIVTKPSNIEIFRLRRAKNRFYQRILNKT